MIKSIASVALIATTVLMSCQESKHTALSEQAIKIHDEIMPQISHFDRTSLKIDSILSNLEVIKSNHTDLDTTNTRIELVTLQNNIESATDFMMEWMMQYQPDSTDVVYQENEIERISKMKNQFDAVKTEIESKMQTFK